MLAAIPGPQREMAEGCHRRVQVEEVPGVLERFAAAGERRRDIAVQPDVLADSEVRRAVVEVVAAGTAHSARASAAGVR